MPPSYRVQARNTATASANKIHDDDVARRYGFGGGLVPGVDVYAYLTHPVVARWGRRWLEEGTIEARFVAPVYDGEEVAVEAHPHQEGGGGDLAMELTLRNGAGVACAVGRAGLAHRPPAPPEPGDWPEAPVPPEPPPASAATLVAGSALGTIETVFDAALARTYLGEVGETLALYASGAPAHPGWLLRRANRVLAANVVLGPWIHVASEVRHLGTVGDGDVVRTYANVIGTDERKGHRFVELDVLSVTGRAGPVQRVRHTAIYEPRVSAGATS